MCISTAVERRIRRQTFCTSALYSQRLLYQRHLALFSHSAENFFRPFCQQYQAKRKTHIDHQHYASKKFQLQSLSCRSDHSVAKEEMVAPSKKLFENEEKKLDPSAFL
jgi:hypothetical protein